MKKTILIAVLFAAGTSMAARVNGVSQIDPNCTSKECDRDGYLFTGTKTELPENESTVSRERGGTTLSIDRFVENGKRTVLKAKDFNSCEDLQDKIDEVEIATVVSKNKLFLGHFGPKVTSYYTAVYDNAICYDLGMGDSADSFLMKNKYTGEVERCAIEKCFGDIDN